MRSNGTPNGTNGLLATVCNSAWYMTWNTSKISYSGARMCAIRLALVRDKGPGAMAYGGVCACMRSEVVTKIFLPDSRRPSPDFIKVQNRPTAATSTLVIDWLANLSTG